MECTLTNKELILKSRQWIKKLCESGGHDWSLRVPVDFNNDPDILFSELRSRLESNSIEGEAVAFADWIDDNNYVTVLYKGEKKWCVWEVAEYGSANETNYMTLSQLYELFKKQK